jgi:hypothetical protein
LLGGVLVVSGILMVRYGESQLAVVGVGTGELLGTGRRPKRAHAYKGSMWLVFGEVTLPETWRAKGKRKR